MKMLYLLLGLLIAATAVLMLGNQDEPILSMNRDDFARLAFLLPILLMIAAGMLRHRIGENIRNLALWLLILLALVAAYVYRADASAVADRLMGGLMPGRVSVTTAADGRTEVALGKRLDGHFAADVTVQGQAVSMMVDTGASMIALTRRDAARIGIDVSNLDYRMSVMTANGRSLVAPVTLKEVSLGPITRRNVRAMVAEDGKLDQSLLGMSFLGTLGSVQISGDRLRLVD